MFDLFWDLHQQRQISETQNRADTAAREAGDAHRELTMLRRTVEQMVLTNMAMWELVRDRLHLSEHELIDKMQEIDLRDGVQDGRITPSSAVKQCIGCNRRLAPRHERCMYCGQPNARYSPFVAR